jgi:hypothetical protein
MEKTSLSRRNFLKKASLALPLSTALPMTMAAAPQAGAPAAASRGNTYFDKGTRLSYRSIIANARTQLEWLLNQPNKKP